MQLASPDIVITTSVAHGGAVTSLKYKGWELLDSADNGRLLQSAIHYDDYGEACNPTEGGDDTGKPTSKKLNQKKVGPYLMTDTKMSYWFSVGTLCKPQLNLLHSTYHFEAPNILTRNVTYTIPDKYEKATVEALTGYLNQYFNHAIFYDYEHDIEYPVPKDWAGEQRYPVIHYMYNKQLAVGVFAYDLPQLNANGDLVAGYGRWWYPWAKVAKFNCVHRLTNTHPGDVVSYQCKVIIGTLEEVKTTIRNLVQ